MTIRFLTRHAAAGFVLLVLGGLAAGAPIVNAVGGPPRSVFLQLPADVPEPQVSLSATRTTAGRWQLEIDAGAFRFTDLCLTEARPIPVGHAHIIHDGAKIASAFSPVVDLGMLPPGRHHLQAVLRGQDHRALVGRQGLIKADLVIVVPAEPQPAPAATQGPNQS